MQIDDPVELAREQKYFDHAYDCREGLRDRLQAPTEAGIHKGAHETLMQIRERELRDLGDPTEAVAFGRFDLEDGETFYIGKHLIKTPDDDVVVINWKTDFASVFYEATPEDPLGLVKRRQYSCSFNTIDSIDELVYSQLAEDLQELTGPRPIDDSLLTSLESGRTGEMHDIVQTIQAAQSCIIREEADQLLVVQGGPGTGKTAIALHRVSWLLWNRDDLLTPKSVLVLGPNKTFVRYIRQVLPDLGDAEVAQIPVTELGPRVLVDRVEAPEVVRLKGLTKMAGLIRRGLDNRIGLPDDVVLQDRKGLEEQITRLRRLPYNVGRSAFRDVLRTRRDSVSGPSIGDVDALVDRVWPPLTAASFLNDLFGSERRLLAASGGDLTGDEIMLLYRRSAERRADERWSPSDIPLLDEAEYRITGREPDQYQHIVVDEAQDLSPMQLRMISRRSVDGSMTVLGDIAQSTGPFARDSWDLLIEELEDSVPPRIVELELGYRVPRQVFDFAAQVLPVAAPGITAPTVVRDGDEEPLLVEADDDDLGDAAVAAASAYLARGFLVGVICPEPRTEQLERALRRADVRYGNAADGGVQAGINLITPAMSKGLEFDATVVVDPASIVESDERGARLLYVALTRTTNRLTVVHMGDPLPVGPVPDPEEAVEESSGSAGDDAAEPVGTGDDLILVDDQPIPFSPVDDGTAVTAPETPVVAAPPTDHTTADDTTAETTTPDHTTEASSNAGATATEVSSEGNDHEPDDDTNPPPVPGDRPNRLVAVMAGGIAEDLLNSVRPEQIPAVYAEIGDRLGLARPMSDGSADAPEPMAGVPERAPRTHGRADYVLRSLRDEAAFPALMLTARLVRMMLIEHLDSLGTTWGVTMSPGGSTKRLVNVNISDQYLLAVTREKDGVETRLWLASDDDDGRAIAARHSGEAIAGLGRGVPNVGIRVQGLAKGEALLNDPDVIARSRELVAGKVTHRFADVRWHNPHAWIVVETVLALQDADS